MSKKFYRIYQTPLGELATILFDDAKVKECTLAVGRDDMPHILSLEVGKAYMDSDGDYWIRVE